MFLCPCFAGARVRVLIPSSVAVRSERASELADAEKRLRRLLSEPAERREEPSGIVLRAAGWRAEGAAKRETELAALRRLWEGLRVEEDARAAIIPAALPGRAAARLPEQRLRRLLGAGLTRQSQDRFYDGSSASGRAAPPIAAAGAAPVAKTPALAGPISDLRVRSGIPLLAYTGRAQKPSLAHGAWEVVKGGGGVVRDMVSWKGLAVVVGAVALVTIAPVTVYGLLALGAAVGGWTIGQALLHGSAAYRDGDVERFNAACRELGRGALSLGLSIYGARYAPINLKPHIPRTGGEWKALSSSMDDESVVLFSLLRGKGSAPGPEPPPR